MPMTKRFNSQTVEDYLKAIYSLESQDARVKTSLLAKRLGLTPGSVSDMLKRLSVADSPLIDYRHHRGVTLTAAGRRVALSVVRRHRLLETFLHRMLGFGWDEVHQEAEILEHHLSERVTDALDRLMNYPGFDPHGEAIPSKAGEVGHSARLPLSEVEAGAAVRVARVDPRRNEMLSYLDDLGVGVGTGVVVEEKAPFNGPLRLRIGLGADAHVRMVGREVSDHIYVEPIGSKKF
jgi:DtxR family Mn-dependent transcriptional regulator